MTTISDLQPLVEEPMERLEVEYKVWLDLRDPHHRAVLAKAAIALANHGGGYIVIGMVEDGATVRSEPPPAELPEITQDRVNDAIHRFAEPAFHCGVRVVARRDNGVQHPVIIVPGGMLVPVMSRSDQRPLRQYACYIRKPGPRSEEPNNEAEWRDLFNRCIRANQDEMLDAIRTIIEGRPQTVDSAPGVVQELRDYSASSHNRWAELVSTLPDTAPSRFPDGYWEIGLSLVGSIPATSPTQVRSRMDAAGRVMLNGWPLFLILNREGLEPYPYEDCIEAWVGRPVPSRAFDDPQHSDFWRASLDGKLYSIRGHIEDGTPRLFGAPGGTFDINLAVRRIGEGLLFASRLAETFGEVEQIAVYCRFTGLAGRQLTALNTDDIPLVTPHSCRADNVILEAQATPQQVRDNLAEVMHPLLSPLSEQFDFYDLELARVQSELRNMRAESWRERR